MSNNMVVPKPSLHTHISRGGCMEQKPAKTIKSGKTTIKIYAPPSMSKDEHERRVRGICRAAWSIWNSLSTEEKLKINAECSK